LPQSHSNRRLLLLGNPDKSEAVAQLELLKAFVTMRCVLVGARQSLDASGAAVDRVAVLGGDGSLIGVARSLGEQQVPLIEINTGKLGFLTEFSQEEFRHCFDDAMANDGLISRRTLLEVRAGGASEDTLRCLAVNDCVIQAGPPFRMVNLGVYVNGEHLTDVRGDGLIVCTPLGSTAHNLSAGGPIMQADVDALGLTGLNAHSLTHKPLVMARDVQIEIEALSVNEGTTVIVDGQVVHPLRRGDRVRMRRFRSDLQIVRNPRHSAWHKLVTKLHWGRAPNFD